MKGVVLAAALALVACTTSEPSPTPAQQRVTRAYEVCNAEVGHTMRLQSVEPDGRFRWAPASSMFADDPARPRFQQCLRDRFGFRFAGDRGFGQGRQQPEGAPLWAAPPAVAAAPLPPVVGAPVWKRGYEWSYRFDSPGGKGTFVWTVDREEVSDGIECYVIKTGTREIFYRKSDLAHVRETVDGVLINRALPPRLRYVWPLVVGKTWEQSYLEERPKDRQTEEIERTHSVDAEEPVTVPAGIFQAFRITARNTRNGSLAYEVWYAPAAMQWVKIREHLASGLREREMIAHKVSTVPHLGASIESTGSPG